MGGAPDKRFRAGAGACALACALALGATGVLGAAAAPAAAAPGGPSKGKGGGKGSPTKAEEKRAIRRKNATQRRPNVIVITTDDQNESMEGLPLTQSLLGGQGTTFRNSYVSFPLCCPSRATFLTGQYSHNHGVFTIELPNGYNGLNHLNTLPVWLRTSGYRTAMVGKYLNGYGIDDGIVGADDRRARDPAGLERVVRPHRRSRTAPLQVQAERAGQDPLLQGRRPQLRHRRALEQGRRLRQAPGAASGSPSSCGSTRRRPTARRAVFPGALRDPPPARRHLGRYEFATAPRTPNFDEADVSDKPPSVQRA